MNANLRDIIPFLKGIMNDNLKIEKDEELCRSIKVYADENLVLNLSTIKKENLKYSFTTNGLILNLKTMEYIVAKFVKSNSFKKLEKLFNNKIQGDYYECNYLNFSKLKELFNSSLEAKLSTFKSRVTDTSSMALGRAFHTYILEPDVFKKEYFIYPKLNLRTKEGKETKLRIESENKDRILISKDDFNKMFHMKHSLNKNAFFQTLLNHKDTLKEFAICGVINGVKVKCKIDLINPTLGFIGDLKTTMKADFKSINSTIYNSKYHLQLYFYKLIAEQFFKTKFNNLYIFAIDNKPNNYGLYGFLNVKLDIGDFEESEEEILNLIEEYENLKRVDDFNLFNYENKEVCLSQKPIYYKNFLGVKNEKSFFGIRN